MGGERLALAASLGLNHISSVSSVEPAWAGEGNVGSKQGHHDVKSSGPSSGKGHIQGGKFCNSAAGVEAVLRRDRGPEGQESGETE